MSYSEDFEIVGGTTSPNSFDGETVTGWTAGGTAVTPIVTNADNRGGSASIEMRATAGLATYTHDIAVGQGFQITTETLNVWFRYSKGKGASYLGDGSTLVIRVFFGGTVDWADYRPLDNADEDLDFGWNLLQVSGKELNGGSTSGTWSNTDSNWDREVRRIEMRLNLQNANDKDTEDAPMLMDSWFSGTKVIVSEGTPAAPVTLENVETYCNDRTVNRGGGTKPFALGLINIEDVFADIRCGIDVGNGSDGLNNEGNLKILQKFLLFNQWSEDAKHNVVTKNFSTLESGEVDNGVDNDYPVKGCFFVLPPSRFSDFICENGGTIKGFDSKFFRWRNLDFGAASDTSSTIELRRVQIDSCNLARFRANTMDFADIEIYNNANIGSATPQCAEITKSPNSCSNFLVHDCAQGMHFRANVTITEYLAQDNTGNDLAVLDGFEATLVDSVFDDTKIGRLTS